LIFVFIGVVNEHWYISKNLQKYYALNVFIGAITNIILNYFLIPSFGISGAAYSTILTYLFIIFLFDIFNKKTRVLLKMKYKSIISL
jgi:O-antigen/teichoic acid export membrane protein